MPVKTRSQTKTTTQETPDEPMSREEETLDELLSRMEEFERQLLPKIETYFEKWLWDIPAVRDKALDRAMANIGPVMLTPEERRKVAESEEYDLLAKLYWAENSIEYEALGGDEKYKALGGGAHFEFLEREIEDGRLSYISYSIWGLDYYLRDLFFDGKGGHVTDCRSLMTEFSDLFHP
jgi:hypothetical protein